MAIIRKSKTRLDDFLVCHCIPAGGVEVLLSINDIVRVQVHKSSYNSSRYNKNKQQYTDIFLTNGNSVIVSENIENIKKQLRNCVI